MINQQPQIANVSDINNRGGCTESGNKTNFRCYLCGYVFTVGDYYRRVDASGFGLTNPLVCAKCDGPDVLDKWRQHNALAVERFWWVGCPQCKV